jgi:hypothetical protein
MANEMVMIPKSKYERLVKSSEDAPNEYFAYGSSQGPPGISAEPKPIVNRESKPPKPFKLTQMNKDQKGFPKPSKPFKQTQMNKDQIGHTKPSKPFKPSQMNKDQKGRPKSRNSTRTKQTRPISKKKQTKSGRKQPWITL